MYRIAVDKLILS